jgi:iron complex transport system substrate-binding protein
VRIMIPLLDRRRDLRIGTIPSRATSSLLQIVLVCLLLIVPALELGAQTVSAVDGRGKRVTLPAPPRRIVSLTPGNTEILFALGLKGRIVGVTEYCDYPAEAQQLPKVGDVNISLEKVIALKPDLVVASASGNRMALERMERLRGSPLPLFVVDPQNLAQLYTAIGSLGQITGQQPQAQQLVRSMKARVQRVQERVAQAKAKPRVLFVIQEQPLWVVGSGNFMDELVTLAGGQNVTRDAGKGFFAYSLEKVVVRRPEVIIAGRETGLSIRDRAVWRQMPAVRNNAIYTLGPEAARPGPRLVNALEELASLLHPRLFGR